MICCVSGAFAMRDAHSREIPIWRAVAAMLWPAATDAAMWTRRASAVVIFLLFTRY